MFRIQPVSYTHLVHVRPTFVFGYPDGVLFVLRVPELVGLAFVAKTSLAKCSRFVFRTFKFESPAPDSRSPPYLARFRTVCIETRGTGVKLSLIHI